MTTVQVFILLLVALFAAIIIIVSIPRQKRAMPFEQVMWFATWVIAASGAWLTLGAVESLPALKPLALFPIAEMPIVPIVLGALGGALVLTVPMWAADHFGEDIADDTDSE
jgi:hypothetical protein